MKRYICVLIFAIAVTALNAQVIQKTIGLRLGYDAQEISYQHPLCNVNRLELTFGVNTFGRNQVGNLCRGMGFNGVYQWVHDLSSVSDRINWYYGLGAAALLHGDLFGIGALGQIGVGYSFDSPIQISLDYRPGFYWLPGAGNIFRLSWNAPCFAVRYHL